MYQIEYLWGVLYCNNALHIIISEEVIVELDRMF